MFPASSYERMSQTNQKKSYAFSDGPQEYLSSFPSSSSRSQDRCKVQAIPRQSRTLSTSPFMAWVCLSSYSLLPSSHGSSCTREHRPTHQKNKRDHTTAHAEKSAFLFLQHFLQILPRMTLRIIHDFLRRSLRNKRTAADTAFGTDI